MPTPPQNGLPFIPIYTFICILPFVQSGVWADVQVFSIRVCYPSQEVDPLVRDREHMMRATDFTKTLYPTSQSFDLLGAQQNPYCMMASDTEAIHYVLRDDFAA